MVEAGLGKKPKITRARKTGGITQTVEYLLHKYEDLS
jgi:hypothetical protein